MRETRKAQRKGTDQRIDNFQAYLRDFWGKATELKRQGITAEQAAERIDLTSHAANYPAIRAPGVDVRAMARAYAVLDGRGK